MGSQDLTSPLLASPTVVSLDSSLSFDFSNLERRFSSVETRKHSDSQILAAAEAQQQMKQMLEALVKTPKPGDISKDLNEEKPVSHVIKKFEDGEYEGPVENDLPEGNGKVTWKNGITFVGSFAKGLFRQGIFTRPDGTTHDGRFIRNVDWNRITVMQFNLVDLESLGFKTEKPGNGLCCIML